MFNTHLNIRILFVVRASPSDSESRADVYADYSAINNNLTILDMDDDSIKIEARLEVMCHHFFISFVM